MLIKLRDLPVYKDVIKAKKEYDVMIQHFWNSNKKEEDATLLEIHQKKIEDIDRQISLLELGRNLEIVKPGLEMENSDIVGWEDDTDINIKRGVLNYYGCMSSMRAAEQMKEDVERLGGNSFMDRMGESEIEVKENLMNLTLKLLEPFQWMEDGLKI